MCDWLVPKFHMSPRLQVDVPIAARFNSSKILQRNMTCIVPPQYYYYVLIRKDMVMVVWSEAGSSPS